MKILFLMVGIALAFLPLQAQEVRGKLLDENDRPLPYANVVLLTRQDSAFVAGTVTDEEGAFAFDALSIGGNLLKVSSVGYQTVYRMCEKGNGTGNLLIAMQPDAVQLQETVVTARRPTYRMKGNSLVTSVSNSLLSTLGSAGEVLAHVPFVQAKDDGYTVFGKGTPLIYLNGRQVRDLTELDRLDAKDIQSVEVITNPGAEYDVTVKSVIKIKTVKPKGEGVGANVWANAGQSKYHFSHAERVDLNYRKGGLDVFGGAYYSHSGTHLDQSNRTHVESENLWEQTSDMILAGTRQYLTANGGFNYMINENHSFGGKYQFSRNPNSKPTISSNYEIYRDGDWFDRSSYDQRWSNQSDDHRLNVYYVGTAGKLNIDFNADYYKGGEHNTQYNQEQNEVQDDRVVTTDNRVNSDLYAAKLVLSHPLGSGELKGGAEYSHTERSDWYLNPEGYLPDSDTRNQEEKVAAFAEYAFSVGKVQMVAGLRYEHVVSDYFDKGVRIDEQSRTYDNLLPNVSLSFPVRNTQWSLSYTAKTRRPAYYELRSNLQYDDRFTYEGGNPLLKPETIHDVTLMGNYRWIQFMASYIYRKDAIEGTSFIYEKDPSVSIFTNINYDRKEELNLSLILSPKFGFYEPTLSLMYQQQFFRVEAMGEYCNLNNPMGVFSLDNNFRFGKGWTANVMGVYSTRGESSVIVLKPNGYVDLSVNKSLLDDRLNLRLKAADLFNSREESYLIYAPHMWFDKTAKLNLRSVSLTVQYRFNASKSKYKGTGAANDELNRL